MVVAGKAMLLSITDYQCSVVPPSCSAVYPEHKSAVDAASLSGPTSPTIKPRVQAGDKLGWVECMHDTGVNTAVMGNKFLSALA